MHFIISIKGQVQGVFFRASTRDKALELGVKGFVKNETDGSVYVEAEGDEDQLNQFVNWCKHGPPRARVDDIKVSVGKVIGFEKFEIRR
jgi:acylphosphatase